MSVVMVQWAAMPTDLSSESSQFRVTLFVGPQPVEGKPFIHSTVFNVKKRSWKGGIQVAVELDQGQAEAISSATRFPQWLSEALAGVPTEDHPSYRDRAQELFVQAVSRCKLDLLLQTGISQENQCLAADTFVSDLINSAVTKQAFIASYVASELDLLPNDTAPSP